jgi:carnitine-CoA ligase
VTSHTGDRTWIDDDDERTIVDLLHRRLEADADGEYLDVVGTKLSAADVADTGGRIAASLHGLGVERGDRVATLVENSPEAVLAWWGIVLAGAVAVPINTAYKGEYLRHQLADSGSKVLLVEPSLLDRAERVTAEVASLGHLLVLGDAAWADRLAASGVATAPQVRASDLGTFIYTGGTTGPSKGCMLTHRYHEVLSRQIGICWRRTADDVVWTPLPMFHFNAIVTAVLGPLIYGGRAAIERRFSVSRFWPEMNRTGATVTSTLGTMA